MKKEKNPFKRYISKLAESNAKNLGNQRLDCCDMNKKNY
ncbi:MAG: LDCC motif putative metal-binding protein [Spirochaetia bacterium]|nr:LDCC motif putative metal-binding protein [Spirochaetia bacterium]